LQARLLATVLGLLGVVWVAVAVSTWYDTKHELNELLDAHLSQAAALLVTQRVDDLEGDNLAPPPHLHKYQARVAFQVWHEGYLIVRSTNAPDTPLAGDATPGLSSWQVGGQEWRVLTTAGREADVVIHVGELESARRHILLASLRSVVWPMLLALPLLALGIWWAVRGSVRPLRELGRTVAVRQAQALGALPVQGVPPEAKPLVEALNGLFARMTELLASERRFTADAAHELRTPIAAIRMQAQVAQGARSEAERGQALADTLAGCDRAAHLVDQLLQLARLEAEAADAGVTGCAQACETGHQTTDLAALARHLLAELAPLVRQRAQIMTLEAPESLPISMDAPLARVLLRNLVDNALRYSPEGATLQVRLEPDRHSTNALDSAADRTGVSLTVEDSGPGLAPEAMARPGERFFRELGTGQSGSGLGWSIVQRIARLHGLQLQVDRSPALGGLRVRVTWPD
jgi:two-component system sensor histidine kinase QseC